MQDIDMLFYENILWKQGFARIAGVDEAGRGPLAGPVVAACVILDPTNIPPDANDSKKLSPKKRETLYDWIMQHALAVGIGIVQHEEIDRINILQATLQAMRMAIADTKVQPDYIIVDGNQLPQTAQDMQAVVGGDGKSATIACASIIAKVTRDRMLCDFATQYPQYGFEKHKGYGTRQHIEAILKHSMCPIHRRTFCTKIYNSSSGSPVSMRVRGDTGEELARSYLEGQGYTILCCNYTCPGGEIDIIARDGNTVVFAEVKRASGERFGDAQSHVTGAKIRKLRTAAQHYISKHDLQDGCLRNDVIAMNNGEITHIKDAF